MLIFGLTLLWSFASAVGRAATLRRLVAMFSTSDDPEPTEWHFRSIFLLQLMRAMWTQIALAVGIVLFLYGSVMASRERAVAAALSISFGVGFAALVGFYLNWYLGIAPLFCIRNGVQRARCGRPGAIVLGSTRRPPVPDGGGILSASSRLGGNDVAGIAGAAQPDGKDQRPLDWFADGMIALIYFGGADLLNLARWGSYVSLTYEDSRSAPLPEASSAAMQPPEMLPLQGLA